MPTALEHAIEFGGEPQDVTIVLSGVATPEGFRRFVEERISDTRFRTGMLVLVDASRLDTSKMSEEALQAAMAPMLEPEWRRPPLAVAIYATDARTFSDAIHTRAHMGGARSHRRVFRSREAARAWLQERRRPTPAPDDGRTVLAGDRVRVADGREGKIVGFVWAEEETALVRLDTGEIRRYLRVELTPLY